MIDVKAPDGYVLVRANDQPETHPPLRGPGSDDQPADDLIEKLNAEIRVLLPDSRWVVISTHNALSVAAFEWPANENSPGVYVWPDWRNAGGWRLEPGADSAAFLSTNHIWLATPSGQSWVQDTSTYECIPVDGAVVDLQLDSHNRWFALTPDSTVVCGDLRDGIHTARGMRVSSTDTGRFTVWPSGYVGVERDGDVVVYEVGATGVSETDRISGSIYWPYAQGAHVVLCLSGRPWYCACESGTLIAIAGQSIWDPGEFTKSGRDAKNRGIRWQPMLLSGPTPPYLAILNVDAEVTDQAALYPVWCSL